MKHLIIAALLLTTIPATAGNDLLNHYNRNYAELPIHELVCFSSKKYLCLENQCEPVKREIYNLISLEKAKAKVSRCDQESCDTHEYNNPEVSGTFLHLTRAGTGFKLNLQDYKFMETATLMLNVFITFGQCYENGIFKK